MLSRIILGISLSVLAVLGASQLVAAPASAADKDCGDFPNQAAAQDFFDRAGPGDPHRLDADGDGVACESNPCPCAKPGSGSGGGGKGKGKKKGKKSWARVVSVTDGDTIKVRLKGRVKSVRLIGIDTPEVFGKKECGGPQASRALKRKLRSGDRVKLVVDPSQDRVDRYGRLLRYVLKGGDDVGRLQVRIGWAEVYVYGGKPFKRVKSYKKVQKKAKKRDRGIWGRC